jgi:hypothetical protein
MIVELTLASALQCRGGFAASWTGHFGNHPATCAVCTRGFEEAAAIGDVSGRCRIPEFRHRRRLGIELLPSGGAGMLCRRFRRHNVARLCTTPDCEMPPARGCCNLELPRVTMFDVTQPPTEVGGTYECRDESGTFELNAAQ